MIRIVNQIINRRYLFFLVLFIFCLVFKIHGSSIGMYDGIIENKLYGSKTEVFGSSRALRSDEWMVHTPYYFSQYYNNYNKYSKQMSYSGQNMILGYNAPVKDITTVAKPFTWGYMIFGNEYGLSWYWCLKLFLLILVSFELMMIITQNDKKISLFGTLLISFAPPLQWWFVPHMTDVFFWAMAVTTITYYFFVVNTNKKKILFTILLPISYIGYVLALFPSCQVPLAFISLALIIGFLIRDRNKITFTKKEWPRIAFAIVLILSILAYFTLTSIDDLKLLMNTVYPGSRVSTGNDMVYKDLFTDLTTLFLPYKDITYLNNCEASTFVHLCPLFLVVFSEIKNNIIDKKDYLIGKILLVIIGVELFFSLVGFPEILAKITFFKYINRMSLIYGFTALLFTLWSIYVIYRYKIKFKKRTIIIAIIVFGLSYLINISNNQLKFMPMYVYILEIIYLCIVSYLFLKGKKILPFIMFSLLIIVSSFLINPISRGINAIKNHKTTELISNIIKDDNSYWLVTDSPAYAGYVLACGARVANATNFYPDYGKWNLIDPDLKNDESYNRYANMTVDLTKNKTEYSLITEDHLHISLNYLDLKKLKIKYIFTLKDLEEDLKNENINNELLYHDRQINIYKLKW